MNRGSLSLKNCFRLSKQTRPLLAYSKGHEDIKEIPKSQRYPGMPSLAHLFKGKAVKDKSSRDRQIVKDIVKYGYSQKEVADYPNLKMLFNNHFLETACLNTRF
jgi:hypothetical protein